MAKFFGNAVKYGKVGGSVFAVRNGVTIERQYQPKVFNPSTSGQVAARAKLKALSQLSEVMGSVIAIPRKGLVSPRNSFTKINYGAMSYENETAEVELASIKLTEGIEALPAVTATRASGGITARMADRVVDVDRIVYALFRRNDDGTIYLVGSAVVDEAGADGTYTTSIPTAYTNQTFVLYAYGVRDNSDNARATFGSISVPSAAMVAQLIVNRTLLESDVTLTETVAVVSAAGNASQNAAPTVEPSESTEGETRSKKK